MKKIILFLVIVITIISCSKDEDFRKSQSDKVNFTINQNDTNYINVNEIEILAKSISLDNNKDDLFRKANVNESLIRNIMPIGTDNDHPSYYIINYKNNSFVILSGDKRTFPVLAFSDENNFELNSEMYPDLLVHWLRTTDEFIANIRSGENDITYNTNKNWTIESIQEYLSPESSKNQILNTNIIEPGCGQISVGGPGVLLYSYGPLIDTRWGQGEGYNNFAPDYSCSEYDNGKTPTGCVATALAQIMKHHEYPSNYNWSIMPNIVYNSTVNSSGTNEIARLMRDIGNATGMDYGCDGSGTNTGNAVSALQNQFGYSSADYADKNFSTIESEISSGYPVILRGGEKVTKWLVFNTYQNGHAWVCDGIKKRKIAIERIVGRGQKIKQCVYSVQYHMNWGWNGSNNGWFTSSHVSGYDFTYKSKMLYNIKN